MDSSATTGLDFQNVWCMFCFTTCTVKNKVKMRPCTGTEALYRLYGP